jgi:hypothetical protein
MGNGGDATPAFRSRGDWILTSDPSVLSAVGFTLLKASQSGYKTGTFGGLRKGIGGTPAVAKTPNCRTFVPRGALPSPLLAAS